MTDYRAALVASHVAHCHGVSMQEVLTLTPGNGKACEARVIAVAISRKLGLDIHSVFGPDAAACAETYVAQCDQRRSADPKFANTWNLMFGRCWTLTEPNKQAA